MNMMHRNSTWTPEMEKMLFKMCREGGRTSVEMAEVLGVSKNAVIGKRNRLGLVVSKNKTAHPPKRPRAPRKAAAKPTPKTSQEADTPIEKVKNGCRFIAVDPRNRPAGMDFEAMCCNAPRMKHSSYCEEHHNRCYIKKRDVKATGEVLEP